MGLLRAQGREGCAARRREVAAGWTDHGVRTTSSFAHWRWTSVGGHTRNAPAIAYIPESNGGSILIHGYRDGLWAKLIGGGFAGPWRRIGSKQIIGAPSAAGTRQPSPYAEAAVRGLHRAPWITRYPTASGFWSAFYPAWKPAG